MEIVGLTMIGSAVVAATRKDAACVVTVTLADVHPSAVPLKFQVMAASSGFRSASVTCVVVREAERLVIEDDRALSAVARVVSSVCRRAKVAATPDVALLTVLSSVVARLASAVSAVARVVSSVTSRE